MVLGIDLGTSGVKIAVINTKRELVHTANMPYPKGLEEWEDWKYCCQTLIKAIPKKIKSKLMACAVDGTSGTVLACDKTGEPISKALPYYLSCLEQDKAVASLVSNGSAARLDSSLARALRLIDQNGKNLLIRHQADWITGWLIGDWRWGEEGNNVRMGWKLIEKSWPTNFSTHSLRKSLPEIIPSGKVLAKIDKLQSKNLDLPDKVLIISGTTDSNASVLASNPRSYEGITILGSTIVLKRFVQKPIEGEGITNHYVGGRWLCGGASNSGCAVLKKIFTDDELIELSRQINTENDSGIRLMPLACKGERFPVNDPNLEPNLEPRPVSDSLYLHALLEAFAKIEADGWHKLISLGIEVPKRIVTIGGGARNPQWRFLREKHIGIPIRTCTEPPALGVALLALQSVEQLRR